MAKRKKVKKSAKKKKPTRVKTLAAPLYSSQERADRLLTVYKSILQIITNEVLPEVGWQSRLEDLLLDESEKEIKKNDFAEVNKAQMPKLIDPWKRQGCVDYMWYFAHDGKTDTQIGIWFVHAEYSWEETSKDFEPLKKRCKDGFPMVFTYLWSENSRVRGYDRWVRRSYFGNFDEVLQVRHLQWEWEDSPDFSYPRRRLGKKFDFISDAGVECNFMKARPDRHQKARAQRQFDIYLQKIYDSVMDSVAAQKEKLNRESA